MPNPQLNAIGALCDGVEVSPGVVVRPRTIGDETDFAAWVVQQRIADAASLRDVLTSEEYAAAIREARRPLDWGDDAVQAVASSREGVEWLARRAVVGDFHDAWTHHRDAVIDAMVWLNLPDPDELKPRGGTPITLWDCVVLLESRGYRRSDIRGMTRRYMGALLASDAEEIAKPSKHPADPLGALRGILTRRGLRPHRVEQLVREAYGRNRSKT